MDAKLGKLLFSYSTNVLFCRNLLSSLFFLRYTIVLKANLSFHKLLLATQNRSAFGRRWPILRAFTRSNENES